MMNYSLNPCLLTCCLSYFCPEKLLHAGMVSCMAFSPDGTSLAAGTYAGSIGIFDPRIPEMQLVLHHGHKGGLTQVCLYLSQLS